MVTRVTDRCDGCMVGDVDLRDGRVKVEWVEVVCSGGCDSMNDGMWL